MKQFLSKLGLFAILMLAVDQVIGGALVRMQRNTDGSDLAYIVDSCHADMLIFGSSRAKRHYDAVMLEDSLGFSCYNCGQDAMGIIHNFALYNALMKRYQPKVVIYDVNPACDLMAIDNNGRFLKGLRPLSSIPEIKQVIESVDQNYWMKGWSNLYNLNNNSGLLKIFRKMQASKENQACYNGYMPQEMEFSERKVKKSDRPVIQQCDQLRLRYMEEFISMSDSVNLILCISPRWYGMDSTYVNRVITLASKHRLCLIDYSNDKKYVHNYRYFYDGTHMNVRGAEEFTRDIIDSLKMKKICGPFDKYEKFQ